MASPPQSGTGADAAEASRTVGLQQEKFNELEARVAALEEDQTQLAELRELLADRGERSSASCQVIN